MEVMKITKENFDKEVAGANVPVLVDFWATWCGPCKMQGPVMDEVAGEYESIKVGKVNIDEEHLLAMKFGVSSIPTLILFKDGKVEKTLIGLRSKEQIVEELGL